MNEFKDLRLVYNLSLITGSLINRLIFTDLEDETLEVRFNIDYLLFDK